MFVTRTNQGILDVAFKPESDVLALQHCGNIRLCRLGSKLVTMPGASLATKRINDLGDDIGLLHWFSGRLHYTVQGWMSGHLCLRSVDLLSERPAEQTIRLEWGQRSDILVAPSGQVALLEPPFYNKETSGVGRQAYLFTPGYDELALLGRPMTTLYRYQPSHFLVSQDRVGLLNGDTLDITGIAEPFAVRLGYNLGNPCLVGSFCVFHTGKELVSYHLPSGEQVDRRLLPGVASPACRVAASHDTVFVLRHRTLVSYRPTTGSLSIFQLDQPYTFCRVSADSSRLALCSGTRLCILDVEA